MAVTDKAKQFIDREEKFGAHNYHPLDIVIEKGQGPWVWDVDGKKYMDCLSAYSALNQGHCHPRLVKLMQEQCGKLTLTSRAFRQPYLGAWYEAVCKLTGMQRALPMNSGAEAVETAIKCARKWGYMYKGIPEDHAEIIVCDGNFHGRTTTIISMSPEPQYREGFGPLTPGFVMVPYGDIDALAEAINEHTCAFLFEPIQGESGIHMPPPGYLKSACDLCARNHVLFVDDEIQTGLGRTGKTFATEHEAGCEPDMFILGKALGGGFYPISCIATSDHIMSVFRPGDHGSTFGGNPLATCISLEALKIIEDEKLVQNSHDMGEYFMGKLRAMDVPSGVEVRGKGLFIGVELDRRARPYCEALAEAGVLCKETHDNVIRFAPPLVVKKAEIDWACERIAPIMAKLL